MIIVGLDCSPESTGCIKFYLDDTFNIVEIKKMSFMEIPKTSTSAFTDIDTYKPEQFQTFYHRMNYMVPKIVDFCSDASHVALEQYAYGASGKITMLAEFAGYIKAQLFANGKKLRFYDPTTVKIYGSGKGNSKKPEMFDGYGNFSYAPDLSYLPQIKYHKKGKNAGLRNKDGISPLSDLVDAFFICDMLRYELALKSNVVALNDVSDDCKRIMKRTTKITKVDLLGQSFVGK